MTVSSCQVTEKLDLFPKNFKMFLNMIFKIKCKKCDDGTLKGAPLPTCCKTHSFIFKLSLLFSIRTSSILSTDLQGIIFERLVSFRWRLSTRTESGRCRTSPSRALLGIKTRSTNSFGPPSPKTSYAKIFILCTIDLSIINILKTVSCESRLLP